MTVEEAEANFAVLGGKTGELADDELDNVAGGACRYKDGRPVVTVAHDCSNWCCKHDGSEEKIKPMGAWICRTCGIRMSSPSMTSGALESIVSRLKSIPATSSRRTLVLGAAWAVGSIPSTFSSAS